MKSWDKKAYVCDLFNNFCLNLSYLEIVLGPNCWQIHLKFFLKHHDKIHD